MIEIAHGHGGRKSLDLIQQVILPALGAAGAPTLDSARIPNWPAGDLLFSTDSFTISPLFFPGGDIGKLSVCGTVNDLAVAGGHPRFLSLALILEEGLPLDDLRRVMASIGAQAAEVGVQVVCGDTKVVERGKGDGIYTNVTGVATALARAPFGPEAIRPGDTLLISGTVADHGAAILAVRNQLPTASALRSDCAPLWPMTRDILRAGGDAVHAMRDPTRGGLAATLNELALDASVEILLREQDVPLRPEVLEMLEVLGVDPLVVANEGKLVAFVAPDKAAAVLEAMRAHRIGAQAAAIGTVLGRRDPGRVVVQTPFDTRRVLEMPVGEGLPRIC